MTPSHAARSVDLPDAFIDELGMSRDLSELLAVAARWVPIIVDSDRASLTLVSEDGQSLELLAIGDRTAIPDGTSFPIDDSFVGDAFKKQEVLTASNIATLPGVDLRHLARHGFHHAMSAPMVNAGKALGTVNAGRMRMMPFSQLHRHRLRAVANLLGTYIRVQLQLERERERSRWDELTGLFNRKTILEDLRAKLASAPTPESLAVLFLDIDGFKGINDAYGHALGDALLTEIGQRLTVGIRSQDSVGRLGGDEFLAICPLKPGEPALEIAQRLVEHCSQPISVGSITLRPRISVGVTTPRSADQTTEELMAEADHAMYQAKRSSTSVCAVDDDIRRQADRVIAIDRELGQALNADALDFHFQPIMSMSTGRMVGAEALLRWTDPNLGEIPPHLGLERIEATGEIEAFTKWSLDRICSGWSAIRRAVPALADCPVAINLNPSQLQLDRYADWHMDSLDAHSFKPADVIVEIVESGLIEVNARSEHNLRQLADQGVIVGLDDFGTGYNALAYFARFPIHVVKFDRSLTTRLGRDRKIRTIVGGLVQITKELGIVSLAEGVESREEMAIIESLGLDRVQGHLYSPALSAEEVIQFALDEDRSVQPAARAART